MNRISIKNKILLFSLLLSNFCAFARQQEVKILPGEKWWGVFNCEGPNMPYTETGWHDLNIDNKENQAVPLLVSSKGRYIWSDDPYAFKFSQEVIFIKSNYEIHIVQAGKTMKDAYLFACRNHFKPTGTIPDELLFTAPQYNTWIELMYDQNQNDILKYAQNIIDNGYSTGVLMIDDNWQRYYGNFDFKSEKFDNPKEMVDKLHNMGFKVMLWVCPMVSPDSPEFRRLQQKGYLIRKNDGSGDAAIIGWWNGFSACYDMTNPDAFAHFKGLLTDMQKKYGIDGFKLDGGDIQHYIGEYHFFDPQARPVDQVQKWAEIGLSLPFNEYRSCWKMGGQPLVQRLRDKDYSWKGVELLIPDMLATGIMGLPYACPDMIGGGQFLTFLNINSDEFDQELIVRSCQIHALMPMMQFSVAPWRILSKENQDICAKYANLHSQFAPYIIELVNEASISGAPVVRYMEYEFPDQEFEDCKDQFMLGDKYLVAPMLTAGTSRNVKLPEGNWIDEQGKKYNGGKTHKINVPLERLPYFTKVK